MIWGRHADGHVYGDDMVCSEMRGELVEGGVDAGTEASLVVSFLAEDKPASGAAIDAM
jgi:hypothetical protein